MGWDYYTYEAQPNFFIDELLLFLTQESRNSEFKNKKPAENPHIPRVPRGRANIKR